jgi:hypothetical protein
VANPLPMTQGADSNERTVSEARPAMDGALLVVRVLVGGIFAAHGAHRFTAVAKASCAAS